VRIGVVIPAYNAAPWIGDAVVSVQAQAHVDWRLVVVDDGSTDGTAEIVARFADPRIRLIRQVNAGVSAARNVGMAVLAGVQRPLSRACAGEGWGGAACDALLFLDADDWLAPDALTRLATALDAAPHAVAASGPYVFAGARRVRIPPTGDILPRLLVRNLFANGGHVLLRWGAMRRAGRFLPGLRFGEDWEYWIRIALRGPFARTRSRAPVLFVRRHDTGAYRRLAAEPAAFQPCMDAVFGNPLLLTRFGAERLAAIRRRTEAENAWVIGRELIRHDRRRDGIACLQRSFRASPTLRRAVLLAVAALLPAFPAALHGPFRAYRRRESRIA
jgi:glycosyltransferase involved in cell wall biosynthesis